MGYVTLAPLHSDRIRSIKLNPGLLREHYNLTIYNYFSASRGWWVGFFFFDAVLLALAGGMATSFSAYAAMLQRC